MNLIATTDNLDYKEIYERLSMLNNLAELPIGLRVSFDFYKILKDNLLEEDYNKFREFTWGLPITVDLDMEENYRFVYKGE